jgi:hypothetical protein
MEQQAEELAQEVARYTSDVDFGWSSLYANLVVALPDFEEPIQLGTGEVVPQPAVIEEYRPYGWYFAIGVGLIALVGFFGAWRRRPRSAKVRKYLEAELRDQKAQEPGGDERSHPDSP